MDSIVRESYCIRGTQDNYGDEMRNLIAWGVIIAMVAPLLGKTRVVKDEETGIEYTIYVPEIIYPVITLPEIQKMSIREIQTLEPEVVVAAIQKFTIAEISIIQPVKLIYMVSKLSPQEISTISPEKLKSVITRPSSTELQVLSPDTVAIIITGIQERDLDEVLKKITPQGYWYQNQVKLYHAWKKKDIKEIAAIVATARVVQPEFFTAWGNYQNFSEIDWSRREPFQYRQVLVQSVSHARNPISYDWREKFKPEKNIILTIDYDMNAREISALQEMIRRNREKIVMVILPWAGQQVNNYDNKNTDTYREAGEWGDRLFYTVKEVAPNMPVYLTVCWVDHTMKEWLTAFKAPYDGLALWNITNTERAPLEKIYRVMSEYNPNVILSGLFQCQPDTFWIPWEQAKQITLDTYQRAQDAGFRGVILMTNTRD